MLRTTPRLLIVAAAAVLLLAGCGASGDDDASDRPTTTRAEAATTAPDDTTTEPEVTETTETETTELTPPADDDICVPLKVLSDYDAQSGTLINSGDWPATQQFFIDNTDDVLAAYDDAIAIDSEVKEDLVALKAVTVTTAETAAGAGDLMDFSTKLLDQPGIMEAGASGLALNTFAESTCGFSTGGQNQ